MYFPVHHSVGDDYNLVGDVESVSYSTLESPCYVAVKDRTQNSTWSQFYHHSASEAVCNFAEKCRDRGLPVLMKAQFINKRLTIKSITYADSNAKDYEGTF